MALTAYRFDPAHIEARLAEMKKNLREGRGFSDFAAYGLGVLRRRLAANPQQYREFGPYWWAVKQALNDSGAALGDEGDPLVLAAYRGASVEETLVMAEEFKDHYRATWFVGHNRFTLDEEAGEEYVLLDADMEARVPQSA